MRAARDLLQKISEAFPPPPGQRHAIALHDSGLLLALRLADGCTTAILDDADLARDPGAVAEEIAATLRAKCSP
jgi:hypothetical protein